LSTQRSHMIPGAFGAGYFVRSRYFGIKASDGDQFRLDLPYSCGGDQITSSIEPNDFVSTPCCPARPTSCICRFVLFFIVQLFIVIYTYIHSAFIILIRFNYLR
jgi:hypothetical protein